MRIHRRLIGIAAGVVLLGVLPGVAAADTTAAIAETGAITLTIPGAPVTVSVTLDDFGNIDTVGIDDAGFAATRTGEHQLRFSKGAGEGSTEIRIETDGEELTTELRTSNFADALGDNVWSGDIFGTGAITTVTFTVAQAGSGDETYAEITAVVVGTPFDFMLDGPETELTGAGVTFEAESEAEIEFFSDGFLKVLEIEVETEFEADNDHSGIEVKITTVLSGEERRELSNEAVLGTHTWEGLLCDGSTVSVTYTVTSEGVSLDTVSVPDGVTYEVEDVSGDRFEISFTDTNGEDDTYLEVELDFEDGALVLEVESETTETCAGNDKDGADNDNESDNADNDN